MPIEYGFATIVSPLIVASGLGKLRLLEEICNTPLSILLPTITTAVPVEITIPSIVAC